MSVVTGVESEQVYIYYRKVPEIEVRWKNGLLFRKYQQNSQNFFVSPGHDEIKYINNSIIYYQTRKI